MHIITERQFLHLFHISQKGSDKGSDSEKTYKDFIQNARVKTSGGFIPLKKYIKERKIPITDIRELYENIIHRDEYLSRFYEKSLKPVRPLSITESPMPITNINNNSQVKYKNLIRNMYDIDILKNTQSGLENLPSFLSVLEDMYIHNIIDYKILTPSARHYIKNGRIGSVLSSYFFRASIMNPYLVYSLNHRLLKGSRIFTPTLGWTSYCYGFLECPFVTDYVGVDVIPKVCKTTTEFARQFYPEKTTEIYCQPSETLLTNPGFMKKYAEWFDVVFFSPPYYRLELYAGSKQSTTQYKSYSEWLEGYWARTIQLCYHVLKKGGKLCYIISDYKDGDQPIMLVKDTNKITQYMGFRKHRVLKMHNKSVTVNVNQDNNDETICLFVKPDADASVGMR
jgi:hypothetical protein